MGFNFEGETPTEIETPESGWSEIFYNPVLDAWQSKNSSGTVKTFGVGVTLEEVRDMLSLSIKNTTTIEWVFDDNNDEIRANVSQALLGTINSALQPNANISLLTNNSGYQTSSQVATAVNSHASLTNNPHNVTKTQVGLSNVPNVDARARGEHSGTQLASTISNLKQFIDDYLDRFTLEDGQFQVSSLNTFVSRFSFNFTPKNTAKYKIACDFFYSMDIGSSNIEVELFIDGSFIERLEVEVKDSAGTDGASGTDQRINGRVTAFPDLVASNEVPIELRFRTETTGDAATIKGYRLYGERWI